MKHVRFFVVLSLLFIFFLRTQIAYSIYDPFSKENNFVGVHILFPSEIEKAASLINSEKGEWGYVIIPIQAGDRNIEKWQEFMDKCEQHKIIPIIRLSTEGDYFNTHVWRKPHEADILDFANFLDSLHWPTANRYVVILNEMNRFDEWGGEAPNPEEYADLLDYSIDVFKSKSTDFFIIMGGLDNASPNDGIQYLDNLTYIKRMIVHRQTLFNRLDGFASHSYPNPGFSQPPSRRGEESIVTYRHETELIEEVRNRPIPVFITETGWSRERLFDETVAKYFTEAFQVWNEDKDRIVAITPFLLQSQGGPFDNFSLVKNGAETATFQSIKNMEKVKGDPIRSVRKIDEEGAEVLGKQFVSFNYDEKVVYEKYSPFLKYYVKTILGI